MKRRRDFFNYFLDSSSAVVLLTRFYNFSHRVGVASLVTSLADAVSLSQLVVNAVIDKIDSCQAGMPYSHSTTRQLEGGRSV